MARSTSGVRACGPGLVPRLVRPAFCALRVPPCAGAPAPARVRSGAARPPPLRGPGPAHCARRFAPPGPPRGPSGRRSPARPCLRASPSAGSRWPRGPCRPIRSAAGSLSGRPCSAPGRLWACRGPAASSRGRPLARLRGRLAPAPAAARPLGALWAAVAAGALVCAPAPARACSAFLWPLWWSWGSPLRPPAPPPPLGAPGGPVPVPGGLRAPRSEGRVSRDPLAGPPGAEIGHRCAIFGVVDSPKIVNRPQPAAVSDHFTAARQGQGKRTGAVPKCRAGAALTRPVLEFRPAGLDFPRPLWYSGVPRPVPLLRGPPLAGCPWADKAARPSQVGRLFYCSGPAHSLAGTPGLSIAPAAPLLLDARPLHRLTQQNLCHFVAFVINIQSGPGKSMALVFPEFSIPPRRLLGFVFCQPSQLSLTTAVENLGSFRDADRRKKTFLSFPQKIYTIFLYKTISAPRANVKTQTNRIMLYNSPWFSKSFQ